MFFIIADYGDTIVSLLYEEILYILVLYDPPWIASRVGYNNFREIQHVIGQGGASIWMRHISIGSLKFYAKSLKLILFHENLFYFTMSRCQIESSNQPIQYYPSWFRRVNTLLGDITKSKYLEWKYVYTQLFIIYFTNS